MKDLLVICPTRERPEMCARMIKSFKEKTSKCADLMLIIDYDDRFLYDYNDICLDTNTVYIIRHKDKTLCQMYNHIVTDLFNKYDFYSETNDDFIYHTGNWDRILINKIKENGGGIAYGNDGFGGKNLPTTSIISGEIIQAVGWIHMPTLGYLYNDNVWKELGLGLKRLFYVPEVSIEHCHPMAGKAEKDDTFKRTNSIESFQVDQDAFRTWKANQMLIDVNKVKEMYATKNKPICK